MFPLAPGAAFSFALRCATPRAMLRLLWRIVLRRSGSKTLVNQYCGGVAVPRREGAWDASNLTVSLTHEGRPLGFDAAIWRGQLPQPLTSYRRACPVRCRTDKTGPASVLAVLPCGLPNRTNSAASNLYRFIARRLARSDWGR